MPLNTPSLGFAFATTTPHTRVNLATCRCLAGSFFKRHATTPPKKRGAMTDCKHTVSGTISLPSRGTFHPSLTVLTTLSVTPSIQAYRVVPADSQQIPRARCYSGKNTHTPQPHVFRYRTVTVYGRRFHTTSPNTQSQGASQW